MSPATLSVTEMCVLEPRLGALLQEAAAVEDDGPTFCRNTTVAFDPDGRPTLKRRLAQLVGWGSPHPGSALATCRAYEAALHALYEALPPCRACGCVGPDGRFVD
jgi:hypothetical protein